MALYGALERVMAGQIVRIEAGNIVWRTSVAPSGRWIGVCDVLNLTMEGDTHRELQEVIGETLELLFTDLLDHRRLESFLREHGWSAIYAQAPDDGARVDIPWEVRQEHAAATAH